MAFWGVTPSDARVGQAALMVTPSGWGLYGALGVRRGGPPAKLSASHLLSAPTTPEAGHRPCVSTQLPLPWKTWFWLRVPRGPQGSILVLSRAPLPEGRLQPRAPSRHPVVQLC